jgi:hypothetical protein
MVVYPSGCHKEERLNLTLGVLTMTFDEFRRRNLPPEDGAISSTHSQAQSSFFCDPTVDDSVVEDLNEPEMNRFLEWLEGTLLIGDPGEGRA